MTSGCRKAKSFAAGLERKLVRLTSLAACLRGWGGQVIRTGRNTCAREAVGVAAAASGARDEREVMDELDKLLRADGKSSKTSLLDARRVAAANEPQRAAVATDAPFGLRLNFETEHLPNKGRGHSLSAQH